MKNKIPLATNAFIPREERMTQTIVLNSECVNRRDSFDVNILTF